MKQRICFYRYAKQSAHNCIINVNHVVIKPEIDTYNTDNILTLFVSIVFLFVKL